MTKTDSYFQKVAFEFIAQHSDQGSIDRNALVEQTTRHLIADHKCERSFAETIVSKAVGEYDSLSQKVVLNLDCSTPFCLYLKHNDRLRVITTAEILTLLDSQD